MGTQIYHTTRNRSEEKILPPENFYRPLYCPPPLSISVKLILFSCFSDVIWGILSHIKSEGSWSSSSVCHVVYGASSFVYRPVDLLTTTSRKLTCVAFSAQQKFHWLLHYSFCVDCRSVVLRSRLLTSRLFTRSVWPGISWRSGTLCESNLCNIENVRPG
jgi:hypothetical protein